VSVVIEPAVIIGFLLLLNCFCQQQRMSVFGQQFSTSYLFQLKKQQR